MGSLDKLEQLGRLRRDNVITEEEFQRRKTAIMNAPDASDYVNTGIQAAKASWASIPMVWIAGGMILLLMLLAVF